MSELPRALTSARHLIPDDSLTTKEGAGGGSSSTSPNSQTSPTRNSGRGWARVAARRSSKACKDYHSEMPLAATPDHAEADHQPGTTADPAQPQPDLRPRRGIILSDASGVARKTTALTQLVRTHERVVCRRHPDRAGQNRLPVG